MNIERKDAEIKAMIQEIEEMKAMKQELEKNLKMKNDEIVVFEDEIKVAKRPRREATVDFMVVAGSRGGQFNTTRFTVCFEPSQESLGMSIVQDMAGSAYGKPQFVATEVKEGSPA